MRVSPFICFSFVACLPAIAQEAPRPPKPAATVVAPVPTELTCLDLEMWSSDTETFAICRGDVVLKGTNLSITCDRLEITAARISTNTNAIVAELEQFKYLKAEGRVNIRQGDREAQCNLAEVFPREEKVVLNGSPLVIDHSSGTTTSGDEITMLAGERRVRVKNPRVIGQPIRDLGANAASSRPAEPDTAPATTEAAPAPTSQP